MMISNSVYGLLSVCASDVKKSLSLYSYQRILLLKNQTKRKGNKCY